MSDPRGDDKANPEEQFASGPAQREAENFVKNGAGSPRKYRGEDCDSEGEGWWKAKRAAKPRSPDQQEEEAEGTTISVSDLAQLDK